MNPVLKKLGYNENDRVIIFHADDVGMCQSTIPALQGLLDFGLLSSASVMVPCPWFLSVADICRNTPTVDMGVHLTLTSEWEQFRWRPLIGSDPSTGLVDEQGYFPHQSKTVQNSATVAAVEKEIRAQFAAAHHEGIDITHIDSHMGSLFHEKFLSIYHNLSIQNHVPMMMPRWDESSIREYGHSDEGIEAFQQIISQMDEAGMAVFDQIFVMNLQDAWDDGVAQIMDKLEDVKAGLTYFIIHPAVDTPELRAITIDWRARVRDYDAFTSPRLHDYVQEKGFHVIGYRTLRDAM